MNNRQSLSEKRGHPCRVVSKSRRHGSRGETSQGSDLCPIFISVFINDSKDGVPSILIKLEKPGRQDRS